MCTGYEVFFRCLKTAEAYAEIVRWNGPVADFTSLAKLSGPDYGVPDGDLIEATIEGNILRGFINGVEVISATDDTFNTGNPGIEGDWPAQRHARTKPRGQTVARLQSSEGAIIGISYPPSMHSPA